MPQAPIEFGLTARHISKRGYKAQVWFVIHDGIKTV